MKCEACGIENIYGAGLCKACRAPLLPTDTGASRRVPDQEYRAEKSFPDMQNAANQSESEASKTRELTFISYTEHAYFDHFIRGLRFALDFEGRTGREGFWYFTLFQMIILVLTYKIAPLLGELATLVTLMPALAVGVRRLHDTGRPGVWLLAGLIPGLNLVLIYFAMQPGQPDSNAWGHAAVIPAEN